QIQAVASHPRIKVCCSTRITKTDGQPGMFDVTLQNGGQPSVHRVGAIILATGWKPYDASKLSSLGYGLPDVLTNVELERMAAAGPIVRPSTGKPVESVAFVQCAGSRDPNHLPYCSSTCCTGSIRQALQIVEAAPQAMVYIIYDELRTPGVAEEFYRAAQEAGVIFMKGKVKGVGSDLTVTVDDALLQQEVPLSGLDL